MRKNIVKIFIVVVMLLIVFFCIEAKALDDTEKFCDISILGGGKDSSTPLSFEVPGVGRKEGYLYTASFGDKTAFCVDFGKKRGKTYEKISLIDEVKDFSGNRLYSDETVKDMYMVYNWYELNKDSNNNAREFAQAAMWVLAENPDSFDDNKEMTKMFVQVAAGAWMEYFVSPINMLVNHDIYSGDLSCDDCTKIGGNYIIYSIPSGEEKILMNAFFDSYICDQYKDKSPNAYNDCIKWNSSNFTEYDPLEMLNLLEEVVYSYLNATQYSGQQDAIYLSDIYSKHIRSLKNEMMILNNTFFDWKEDTILEMKDTAPYNGKLYLWCVNGDDPGNPKSQCFVAPEVQNCQGCVGELNDIKDKYNFSGMSNDERKNNIAYNNELEKLYDKYGFSLLKDYTNPMCGDPDGNPIYPSCKPTYESNDCKFNSYDGGFKITDAKDEHDDMNNSCWLESGISYNYEEDIVSSDTNLGNKYCPVRCWEELESDFPGAVNNIKSGTFFFWGKGNSSDGLLGSINAGRFCQTTKIDYDTFYSDFNSNENVITDAYNSYLAQKSYNDSSSYNTGDSCCFKTKEVTTPASSVGSGQSGADRCIANGWTCYKCDSSNPSVNDESKNDWCKGGGTSTVCETYGTTYTRDKHTVNGHDSTSGSVCMESSSSASEIDSALDDTTELANRKKTVESLIDTREGLTKAIRSCQSQEFINTNNNDLYNFIGKVTLKYSDPAGIDRNLNSSIDLNHVPNENVTNVPGAITGSLSLTCTQTPLIDNLSGCYGDTNTSSQIFTLTKYSHFAWDYNGEFSFYYPREEYFWKVIVENANAVNEKTYNANYSGMNKVPYVVGYGIPTAFSLIEGYYDISIDVEGFGHNGHFSKVMDKENVSVYNYSCPYKVVNELYGNECNWSCDDATETCTLSENSPAYCKREVKGIDLVYRLIEMPNEDKLDVRKKIVFPSIDGDGRNPGDNWSSYITNHQKGFVNITSQKVIYDDEPIYEIELTPTLIGEIREDTLKYRNENKDPYTSYTDYNNQKKIICDGDDPVTRTCASEWLTDYINAGIITGQYAKNGTTEERVEHIANLKHQYE